MRFWMMMTGVLLMSLRATAQEAFDAEKTKALFAGSEWHAKMGGWSSDVTFTANGTMVVKVDGDGDKNRTDKWTPVGPRSVSGDNAEWVMSPDGKELYVTGSAGSRSKFYVFYRGKKMPPEYPHIRATLAKPGTVWVRQGTETRKTFAFNAELEAVYGEGGNEKKTCFTHFFG
ncbi:MAG: hypothetical protein FWG50_13800, partial [Kiritimatiellaeota bacterium]|nr:hypothetical protein [Kiritimatiellota bacterium]